MVIDKGIPVPDKLAPRATEYPLAVMEVGDSFSIDVTDETIGLVRNQISARATYNRLKRGYKYITRRVVEDDVLRLRTWRVS